MQAVDTWTKLVACAEGSVDEKEIAADLSRRIWDHVFEVEVTKVDPQCLYRIWELMLENPSWLLTLAQFRTSWDKLTGKEALEKRIKQRMMYLSRITKHIFTCFHHTIIISEKLLYLLVANDLCNEVMSLLERPDLFTWSINSKSPVDLVVMFAVDTCNIPMFRLLLKEIQIVHLDYIYHHAPFEFLPVLVQLKSQIPCFSENMLTVLRHSKTSPTWKQREFIVMLNLHGVFPFRSILG